MFKNGFGTVVSIDFVVDINGLRILCIDCQSTYHFSIPNLLSYIQVGVQKDRMFGL